MSPVSHPGRPCTRDAAPRGAQRTRGTALLMAMLLMAVVATLGATAYWQQWRAWTVEQTERAHHQAGWLLTGALDWARLIVREDGRASTVDHLGEPWAVPLQPTRLSQFLERAPASDDADDAWLSGRIEDEQGRLNWRNLIDAVQGQPRLSPAELARFRRLFAVLNLPEAELDHVAQQLLRAWRADRDGANPPLRPQRLGDLAALGLSPPTLAALETLTTWLPEPTPVNVNTAPAPVLQAAVGLDAMGARRMVETRARGHFRSVEAFIAALGRADLTPDATRLSVTSRHFRVTGRVRIGDTEVEQQALLVRDGTRVNVLWRQQRPLSAPLPASAVAPERG